MGILLEFYWKKNYLQFTGCKKANVSKSQFTESCDHNLLDQQIHSLLGHVTTVYPMVWSWFTELGKFKKNQPIYSGYSRVAHSKKTEKKKPNFFMTFILGKLQVVFQEIWKKHVQ